MKIKGNSLLILYSLMALAACKQEIVAPEQQITGKFALDDGTGLTDRVIEFNCGILSDWHSALFPLADNQIWDSKQQQLILNSQSKYSIQSGTLISSFLNGQIEREGDILTIGESRFVHLNGFRDEPYSVISPEKTQYEIPLQEEEYSFPVTVENPIPAGELTVSTVDDWIAGLTLKDGIVFYRVSTTKKPRQGRITLNYTHATNVRVVVKQSVATFIRLAEMSKTIGYAATTVEIPYTVENPVDGSELAVSSTSDWCQNIVIQGDKVVINIPENNSGYKRTATLTFSYVGAQDISFTLTQEWSASSIILSPSSATADYTGGSALFTIEIQNPREGITCTAASQVDWITDVVLSDNSVSYKVAENNSRSYRSGRIMLTYGNYATATFYVTQSWAASSIVLSSSSAQFDYTGGSDSFTFEIQNPREGVSVTATSQVDWITDVTLDGDTVSYKVSENNSAGPRTGKIKLTYGTYATATFSVTQSWAASLIVLSSSSAQFDYTGGSDSFTFEIQNPREGVSVTATSQVDWITDVALDGNTVSYKVSENNSVGSRTGKIKLTYGTYATTEYSVAQNGKTVTSLTLNKTLIALLIGKSEKLIATVDPSDAKLIWSSSDTSVASVSDGTVTGVGNGTTTITVKPEDGSKSASCTVTVTTAVIGISLNKTTLSLVAGQSETLTATVSPSTASNKSVTWSSSNSSVATVTSSGKITAVKGGTARITVTTIDGGKSAVCDVSIIELVVDLGLSVKWASCNLGESGFVNSPEEYGAYYAWGETKSKSTSYSSDTYTYKNNPAKLPLSADAAHVILGGNWRMPTREECNELISKCTSTWTTQNGVNGRLFKRNGNSIFLPAAGEILLNYILECGSTGAYWSSSIYDSDFARGLYFGSNSVWDSFTYRYYGLSVRPVCED